MPHRHGSVPPPSSPRVHRRLVAVLLPFAVATVVGLATLWPSDAGTDAAVAAAEHHDAVVVDVDEGGCPSPPGGVDLVCAVVTARLERAGEDASTLSFQASGGRNQRRFEPGDRIIVARGGGAEGEPGYYFVDFRRDRPLLLLVFLFVAVVVGLSRWRGVTSLIGLGLSLMVLVSFVIPAILQGSSPVLVAIVGSATIMFIALYLAHGFNVRTTSAVLGTLVSLALTGALAVTFVELAQFTGFASEEASFLQVSAGQINLQGLLLGGIIIGTLGVLDDVTVTQASAVWELHVARPTYAFGDLYRAALRIGRDHIASTVNTLVLAYAGASLPLLILFTLSDRGFSSIVTTEVVAEEVVRTLVGSIGLVASVPITTGITALVVTKGHAAHRHDDDPQDEPRLGEGDPAAEGGIARGARSRYEREWFGE